MERRKFIKSLIRGITATAAVRTFPFKVFSFPSHIKIAKPYEFRPYYDFKLMEMPKIPRDVYYYLGAEGILWKHHPGVQKTNISFPISSEIENLDLTTMHIVETGDGVIIGDRYNTYRYRTIGEDQHWARVIN